jgi:hypothetical protein
VPRHTDATTGRTTGGDAGLQARDPAACATCSISAHPVEARDTGCSRPRSPARLPSFAALDLGVSGPPPRGSAFGRVANFGSSPPDRGLAALDHGSGPANRIARERTIPAASSATPWRLPAVWSGLVGPGLRRPIRAAVDRPGSTDGARFFRMNPYFPMREHSREFSGYILECPDHCPSNRVMILCQRP